MNLSSKQIQALVREIMPDVQAMQKSQLEAMKPVLMKEIEKEIDKLKIPFDIIGKNYIYGFLISKDILKIFDCENAYISSEYKSREDLIEKLYSAIVMKKFNQKYGAQIKAEDIEHEIIIGTI